MISIILIDDHELFRLGVRGVLERSHSDIQIVAEAETGKELFDLLPHTEADVVLLDINLPDMSGIDIARRLRNDYPALKILAVSAENNAETVRALLDIGIDGFISKRMARADEMLQAIHSVVGGLDYFGRDIASIIYEIYVAKKKTSDLTAEFTERERDIIRLCREGLQSKEIADRLCISYRTVDTHKRNIFQKLGINNTVEMVKYALKQGIISLDQ